MSKVPRTIPHHFVAAAERHGDRPILQDRDGTVNLRELMGEAAEVAHGLRAAGVKKGDRVGFYADNSRRWILTDLGIQLCGGVSVPRGTDTPPEEMAELFCHAEVGIVFAHSGRHAKAIDAERERVPSMGEVISMDPKDAPGRTLDDVRAAGAGGPSFEELTRDVKPEDLATIIYTSGTTGRPKGVMLRQSNFGHQVAVCPGVFQIGPDESFLSVLPVWHIFERTVEYVALVSSARLIYTDRRRFKDDLARYQPTFVPSVPRIWETVYTGVHKKLEGASSFRRGMFRAGYMMAAAWARSWDRARGHTLRIHKPRGVGAVIEGLTRAGALLGATLAWIPNRLAHAVVFKKLRQLTGDRLLGAISGGGLMPAHMDHFFRNINLPILVGYGLTETSPVLTVRRMDRNVLGTIGVAVPEVELEIRDPETGKALPPGEVGLVFTRGPQVMPGYYKDEELTRQVIDEGGWFDTGDLGMLTEYGDLCFRGRLKETIVLKGGENVEPSRVEEAILASPLVSQAIVVGQDRKALAVLVTPEKDELARDLGVEASALESDAMVKRLHREAVERTRDLKAFERVRQIALLPEPLEVENGCLTQTLKPRRHVIVERFAAQIEEAYQT